MTDNDQFEHSTDENRFPLSISDRPKITKIIHLVRRQLAAMTPGELRAAASALLALERLPVITPGIQVSFGFKESSRDGNYAWTDIKISESEFLLLVGEHFYDPSVGGDTETRIEFEAYAGGEGSTGDIEDWLKEADMIALAGLVSVEDYSDHDSVNWYADEEDVWGEPRD